MPQLLNRCFASAIITALAWPAFAQDEVGPTGALDAIEASVTTHKLDNGWTFLIVPRHSAPVVSFHTYIDVGAIFESDGATGMAHMFEHMAFKGSDRIGTTNWPEEKQTLDELEAAYLQQLAARAAGDEQTAQAARVSFENAQARAKGFVKSEAFSRILGEAGGSGSLNASTSAEETRYVVSLPSNRVELWAWMERERFARPVLREFYKERDAVLEERRMRVESSPFGALLEALYATAFTKHPYRRPVIGYAEDLKRYTRTEAEAFYKKNYGVRRFVTAIVGDVDPDSLIPLLERYFGDLPPGPEPTKVDIIEPAQGAERRIEVEFPAMPVVIGAWHVPARLAPDYPALELGFHILAQAQTSRLDTALVRKAGVAAQIGGALGLPGSRYPHLALLFGVPSNTSSTEELEQVLLSEVARFVAEGPSKEELLAARATFRANLIRQVASNADFAANLCEWQSKSGDWRNLLRQTGAFEKVTSEEIRTAMGHYFTSTNRTIATLVPPLPVPSKEAQSK